MDLRSFKIHRLDRHVRAVVGDHRGEQARDLEGAVYERVLAAAEPLFVALAERAGAPVRALSVDGVRRVLRLTTDTTPPRPLVLSGREFDELVPQLATAARATLGELRVRTDDLAGATQSDTAFWDHLYSDDNAGWELGRATPPLVEYFNMYTPAGLRTLVIGCGRGHEARMLARLGAQVTAIDLSPRAIAAARSLDDPTVENIEYRVADLFAPTSERYELIVEHTCFCAIDPGRRDEYVERTADALVPGGALVGLFYAHGRGGGPPHTTSADELRRRFARRYELASLKMAERSILVRAEQELLGEFIRR